VTERLTTDDRDRLVSELRAFAGDERAVIDTPSRTLIGSPASGSGHFRHAGHEFKPEAAQVTR
jgi:hypothetical protein